ncbi:hypothetical protein BC477_14970 [Clavibacter michiganensis subsp. michiganensis]|uniref:Uncharacterized protein n=1 Tax=Clavibacter michiganensis subsp. michiganensis TaxID=33013 RepID=A0A251XCI1_CLAMM|nr:hypothetical protein BC477_14970 [Clavibacter michiganensis subsp. michiganensis]OUD99859.1 hypothetical protein CMMCAS07_20505 [Clavibacter michiganensis subsp. michiganensis]
MAGRASGSGSASRGVARTTDAVAAASAAAGSGSAPSRSGASSGTGCSVGGSSWRASLRSTRPSERIPLSRCHCAYAATTPLARACDRSVAASACGQSPVRRAERSARVSGSSRGDPGGAAASATTPPSCTTNAECGPGAPVTAQSWKLGAQPAIDRLRRRYESSVRLAPCSWRLSDRRAPTRSRYCWSEPSSSVTRSAVSTIALAAV